MFAQRMLSPCRCHSRSVASIDSDHFEHSLFRLQPVLAIYNAESGARRKPAHRNRQPGCQPDG